MELFKKQFSLQNEFHDALAFKNIYIKGLKELKNSGELIFPGNTAKYENDAEFYRLINKIAKKKWCGYSKAPFSGPKKVLET